MIKDRVEQIISETAKSLGFDIYEAGVMIKGKNSKIAVKIDSEIGITISDCENYSRELSVRLDSEELLPNYSLEVSSPGLKRLLRKMDDYRRFTGSPVKIVAEIDGKRDAVKGIIESVNGETVIIKTERDRKTIPLSAVSRANLDY